MRVAAALAFLLLAGPSVAQEQPTAPSTSSGITITLGVTGDADRRIVMYQCQGRDALLRVEYVNAPPNFLALVPVEEGTLVFVHVLSADGARYAASHWVWWTKGADADLYDLTKGRDADPVMHCSQNVDAP